MAEETTYRTSSDEMRIELPETAPPPEVDPQADRRAEIAEAYERRREQEIVAQREQMGLPPIEAAEEVEETGAEETPQEAANPETPLPGASRTAPATEPVAPPAATPQAQPQPPQLIQWTLPDGRQTWVTPEQVIQMAQVGAGYLTQQQRPPQASPQAPAPQPTHRPSFDGERAKAIAQRLSFGTTDEQAAALVEFADAVRPAEAPRVDVDAIRRQASQEAVAQIRLEHNLTIIGHEYPEVFNDPVLTQVAALQLSNLRGNPYNAQRPDLDLYREACNQVRSRFNIAALQPQPGSQTPPAAPQAPAPSARLERKRAAPSIPGGADHRLVMADAEPREPTTAEVIANMRKARNQPAIS